MNNKIKTLIILSFWLILALFFIGINEKVFIIGEEIRLKVQPVDPRDFLRGQYVSLNYDISNIDVKKSENFVTGQTVFTVLQKNGETYTLKRISTNKPAETPFIKGQINHIKWNSGDNKKDYNTLNIRYGIENVFVKEKEAKNIEKRLAKGGIAIIKLDRNGVAKVLRVE